MDLATIGVVAGMAPGICLALLLVFERRLLRSLAGVPVAHAVAVVGALLLAYLLRAFLTTMAEPGLKWMPWAFVLAATVATVRGLALGIDASSAGGGVANDAAVLRLSWHLFLPLYVLAALRPAAARRVHPVLTVVWGALIAATSAAGASADSVLGLRFVGQDGAVTAGAVAVGLPLAVGSLAVTALWARAVGFRPLAPQAWVGTSLLLGTASLLTWIAAGRVESVLWWASLLLVAAQFAVPALGLLMSLVTIYRAMDRYERYLEERLAHMLDAQRPPRTGAEVGDAGQARAGTEKLLADGGLTMVFQPVVRLGDATVVGLEALARCAEDPQRSPETFFAEAEACGLGPELELHALRLALGHLEDLDHRLFLAVNVSPDVLVTSELGRVLEGTDLGRLVLEVTERAAIEDFDEVRDSVERFREAGMRLAIDDTGAGYAGLRHVLGLRPDILKLDIELCREIDRDSMRGALAQALATFTTGVGSTLVAEGVETPEVVRELLDRGIELGQGFHFGHPRPMAEALGAAAGEERSAPPMVPDGAP